VPSFHIVHCYSLQVWTLFDGGYCLLYCTMLQSSGLDTMWCGWQVPAFHTLQVWTLCDVVGKFRPSILYSATFVRFGHYVMWLVGTCLLYCIVLLSSGLVTLWCGWQVPDFTVEFYSPEIWTLYDTVQCYSLQVWSLCDVVGRDLPTMLYSATVVRFRHYVMWLLGTCRPYCTVLQSSGLVTMWCGW
jgi:hypothetical protein